MTKLQDWAVSSASNKATKVRMRNYITLDELAKEVMPLLSPYVHITIEEQIPVFTEWVESCLSGHTKPRKKNSWSWLKP